MPLSNKTYKVKPRIHKEMASYQK